MVFHFLNTLPKGENFRLFHFMIKALSVKISNVGNIMEVVNDKIDNILG